MGKRILLMPIVILIVFLLFAAPAYADGGFIGKGGRDISEPEQKAVIFYHEGMEELVLSVRYDGASQDLAWLVPTPEPPLIEEADIALFQVMSTLTPASAYGEEKGRGWNSQLGMESGVDVLDEMTVGAFDLTVLRAGDAGELRAWLEERGFAYDGEAETVLADYIGRSWCFTAMRINPAFMDPASGGAEYELSEGTVDPLRFTFSASEPVYPLRISSLNPGDTEVLLYVLAPQAYGHESLELEYAEKWQPVQIGELAEYSELAGKLKDAGGCCVTKLRRTFSPKDMEDLYLTPVGEKELAAWAGFASAGNNGWPWWALLAVVLALGALAGTAYGLWGRRVNGWPKRSLVAFLVTALVSAAVVFPLGMWILPGEAEGDADQHADWPWQDDILVNHNGWSKLVHPDGRVEILGLDEWLTSMINPPQSNFTQVYEPAVGLVSVTQELGGEGGWKWSEREIRTETGQTRYLTVEDSGSGEVHEVEIGMVEVHDVRLSPGGDRLWVVLNPGVPVNKTELREYVFPTLEMVRSIIHNECLRIGEIALSSDGEPLLAGRFDCGEEQTDTAFGFLPMLEEGAGFVGEPLVIKYDDLRSSEDMRIMGLFGSYFCDAMDASPFLLLSGDDLTTGESRTFVLDTDSGELYEVYRGFPSGWQ